MAEQSKSWTLATIARLVGGEAYGPAELALRRPVPAGSDDPEGITFATNETFLRKAMASNVGAVVAPSETRPESKPLILVPDPRAAFALVLGHMQKQIPLNDGVHPTAIVSAEATVHPDASIGAYVVIEPGAVVESKARIFPFCYIGQDCFVGAGSTLFPHVTLIQDVRLGSGCTLHAGAVLGADGFGFAFDGVTQRKIPQVGGVCLGNDVEVGANTTIDRATCGDTCLDDHVKLDNLIQVGHNVTIGANTVVAALVGFSGSSSVGRRVTIGGQAALSQHVHVADDVKLGGRTGVIGDIDTPGEYVGLPPMPLATAMRAMALQSRLPDLFQRIRALERELEKLKPAE